MTSEPTPWNPPKLQPDILITHDDRDRLMRDNAALGVKLAQLSKENLELTKLLLSATRTLENVLEQMKGLGNA